MATVPRVTRLCACACPKADEMHFKEPTDPPSPPSDGPGTPDGKNPGTPKTPGGSNPGTPGTPDGAKPGAPKTAPGGSGTTPTSADAPEPGSTQRALRPGELFHLWVAGLSRREGTESWMHRNPGDHLVRGRNPRDALERRPAESLFAHARIGSGRARNALELTAQSGEEESHPHAETPCDEQKGTMSAPKYSQAFMSSATQCIRNLVVAHEHDHYFDADLRAACALKAKQKKAGTFGDSARAAWNEAVRKSECRAYAADAACFTKLLECCTVEGEGTKERRILHNRDCCKCSDVNRYLTDAKAFAKKNNCTAVFPEAKPKQR